MMHTNYIVRKLAAAAKYWFAWKPNRLEMPIVMQFPVIDICDSRCRMCRIWENTASQVIAVEELRNGLRNKLFKNIISVGINGGEPTIRQDLPELIEVLFQELPRLANISLITNAINVENVINIIEKVGVVVKKFSGRYEVMVSLDGCGSVHDSVRCRQGAFENAQKVINHIKSSDKVDIIKIGCTIIKDNVYGLADLHEFCQNNNLYVKYRLGIQHRRLYTQDQITPYDLNEEEKYHVAEFLEGIYYHYEKSIPQKFFYRSLIDQLLYNVERKAGCDWQHRGVTITSRGELMYCAVQSRVLGNILTDDSARLYFDNRKDLEDIIKSKCSNCRHDYTGLVPRRYFAKELIVKMLSRIGVEDSFRHVHLRSGVGRLLARRRFEKRRSELSALVRSSGAAINDSGLPRILICGWYGTETLGDKAILGGVVRAIRRALGDAEFTLVSLHPYVSKMTKIQMPELQDFKIVDQDEGIRSAGTFDLVVFGGGPLMALNELAEMEAIFVEANRSMVPTLLAGCGVGPLGDECYNDSLVSILSRASLRIYRDANSLDTAASLGVRDNSDIVAEDPAFTWLEEKSRTITSNPPTDRRILLLGLREFPYLQYARHLSRAKCLAAKERYEREIIIALERLCERFPDLIVRPLPMCTNHFGNDDRWFYRRLFRGNQRLQKRLDQSLLGPELAPETYCQAFMGAHAVLAMRFHALVFSLGLKVPVVAIDYTLGKGKVASLADRFGVPFQSLADLDASFIVMEVEKQLSSPILHAQNFSPVFNDLVLTRLPKIMRRNQTMP